MRGLETGYDTYDSCVVAAVDEESAKRIRPSTIYKVVLDENRQIWINEEDRLSPGEEGYNVVENDRCDDEIDSRDWARHPSQVNAVWIGATTTEQPGTVVCASFNAG